jgi:hypothetical protein
MLEVGQKGCKMNLLEEGSEFWKGLDPGLEIFFFFEKLN